MNYFLVGIGGFFGAIARYWTYVVVQSHLKTTFPFATLVINTLGCFLAGVTVVLIERIVPFHRQLFMVGLMGFLGAYTTFSTFGLETLNLARTEQMISAILNVFASVLLGLFGVWGGRYFASLFM